jgi:DNA modification methylase
VILRGDCIEVMASMDAASVDAIVTDPPYGLGFMGKRWDALPPGEDVAREMLRVLKPGGHLLAFGGTRTYHRLAVAVEDAGFEIRDTIAWLYGSGFPKSHDVSKAIDKAAGAEREVVGEQPDRWTQKGGVLNFSTDRPQESVPVTGAPATPEALGWDGWGTALKPAHEPIVVARKPLDGTVAANVLEHGTGALNIDGTRIEHDGRGIWGNHGQRPENHRAEPGSNGTTMGRGWNAPGSRRHDAGRWPANVVLDEEAADALDPADQWRRFFYVCGAESIEAESTSAGRKTASSDASSRTDGSGSRRTVQSRPDTTSTTATTTGSTTGSTTSNSSNGRDTRPTTEPSEPPRSNETGSACAPDAASGSRSTSTQSGALESGRATASPANPSTCASGERGTESATTRTCAPIALDSGTNPRAFYVAKASRAERNAGLDGFEERAAGNFEDDAYEWATDGKGNPRSAPVAKRNHHPTVKPLALMRWLVRLVTPPGGTVLDPFTGSGTTGCAAALEGFEFVGIEREPEYADLAEARIAHWTEQRAA